MYEDFIMRASKKIFLIETYERQAYFSEFQKVESFAANTAAKPYSFIELRVVTNFLKNN